MAIQAMPRPSIIRAGCPIDGRDLYYSITECGFVCSCGFRLAEEKASPVIAATIPAEDRDLLTVAEIASLKGITAQRVRDVFSGLSGSKPAPAKRQGHTFLYRRQDIDGIDYGFKIGRSDRATRAVVIRPKTELIRAMAPDVLTRLRDDLSAVKIELEARLADIHYKMDAVEVTIGLLTEAQR